jgi:hypothetical protein
MPKEVNDVTLLHPEYEHPDPDAGFSKRVEAIDPPEGEPDPSATQPYPSGEPTQPQKPAAS